MTNFILIVLCSVVTLLCGVAWGVACNMDEVDASISGMHKEIAELRSQLKEKTHD